jgi:hypothetical protein
MLEMLTKFRRIDLKEETTWNTWVKWEYNIKINIKLMEMRMWNRMSLLMIEIYGGLLQTE